MTNGARRRLLALLLSALAVGAGCGGATPGPDGGSPAEAGADAVSGDAFAACADFAGAWRLGGSCTPSTQLVPSLVCVAQRGCEVTLVVDWLRRQHLTTFSGVAEGGQVVLTSEALPGASCTARRIEGYLTIYCGLQGGATCDVIGQQVTPLGATRACCDPSAQDCAAGDQCTIQPVDSGSLFRVTSCRPRGGIVGEGQLCARRAFGQDSCAPGLLCTYIGAADGESMYCRRICMTDDECPAGQTCRALSDMPYAGTCAPACDLFSPACPAGMTCGLEYGVPTQDSMVARAYCDLEGGQIPGAECSGLATACTAGYACARNPPFDDVPRCRPYCDNAHPCAVAGASCVTDQPPARPADQGFCWSAM